MEQQELNYKKIVPMALIAGIFIFFIISWNSITITIGAGEGGVLFKRFGGGIDLENSYGEGFHFIAPWNKMYVYEMRQQEVSEEMNVLSSNGLEIFIDVSSWYQPTAGELAHLHAEIGSNYLHRVVIPGLRSSTRSVIGRYTPEQIYSKKRDVIQDEIFVEITELLADKYVQTNQILIRSVKLPPTIKKAIEGKLKQEQESLEYKFKLEKAQKEAERQIIEAEGKATANRIVSASLTDRILREKGIEATLKLSESNNTKVVVIGSGKDGLPIILGDSK
ncbi:MAG: prohibitin family protein [Bacteroidetes bacterium]|nr:MAG: prohibitin family protein [Bacteroidota bacterium]